MEESWKCPECGNFNLDTQHVCPRCGYRVEDEPFDFDESDNYDYFYDEYGDMDY